MVVTPVEASVIMFRLRFLVGTFVYGEIEPVTRERILLSGLDPVDDATRCLQLDIRESIERELGR